MVFVFERISEDGDSREYWRGQNLVGSTIVS